MNGQYSAFPLSWSLEGSGLTKREYIAAMVLGQLARSEKDRNRIVDDAVSLADALIEKLAVQQPEVQ